jgi:hypothetical protein
MMITAVVSDAAASGTVPSGAIITVSTTPISVDAANPATMGSDSRRIDIASAEARGRSTGGSEAVADILIQNRHWHT